MNLTAEHVRSLREEFPGLLREAGGRRAVFFDGPAGTQTPRCVIEAIGGYLSRTNANHGGVFATGRESDAILEEAHRAAADLVGGTSGEEIAFGANMTSLTFAFSRALGRTWKPGDEVLVTQLDHDANVAPWLLAARDAGASVRTAKMRTADGTLDLDDLRSKITARTRLVAVGCASNATGSINPVKQIAEWAHAAGALVFADAVHFAPHGRMRAVEWGCDFLVCSAYKFFGPHVGMLWGRREHLERLQAYKVRPAPNDLPGKWMTGTQNHEGIAGALAAIEYLARVGRMVSGDALLSRPAALDRGLAAIARYEQKLSEVMLRGLAERPEMTLSGIGDCGRLAERAPTFSLVSSRCAPRELAERLAERGVFAWQGNYYALSWSEALEREPQGMVRVGLVHYNTQEEVEYFLGVLAELAAEQGRR